MYRKKELIIKKNESLKNYCTFHTGGKAKYLIEAYSTEDLINACIFCNSLNLKYKIIGFGSNLLFDDKGFDGAIIVNRASKIRFYKNTCFVDAGTPVNTLIKKCLLKNLSGLEQLIGIPSTIGGGVNNNVGAFDAEIGNYIEYVECFDKRNLNKKLKFTNKDCKFGYRTSLFKSNKYIITKVKFVFKNDKYLNICNRLNIALYKKSTTQPINSYSAGSVFKRTPLVPASKLIDDLGLKGMKVGGASVSTLHAGFIIGSKTAKSSDVLSLINLIKQIVREKYSIVLEEEIEYINY